MLCGAGGRDDCGGIYSCIGKKQLKTGDYITYGLLATYVVLAVVEFASGRSGKAVYWCGAAVITCGVLMQK